MKKYFSTHEVAKMCHVTPGSVIRWIHEGKLKAALTAGGHHRLQAEDIRNLLKSLRMPFPADLETEGKIKVLIVDDEQQVRQLLRAYIHKKFPRMEVDEAADGFIAGTKLNEEVPHLVILDIHLPGLNGFQVCEYIRKNPSLKSVVIIAISGVEEEGIHEKALKAGANDFLAKPFSMDMLDVAVRKHLEKSLVESSK